MGWLRGTAGCPLTSRCSGTASSPSRCGGRYTLANIAAACRSCNASKCNDEVTGWLRRKRLDERAFLLRHAEIPAASPSASPPTWTTPAVDARPSIGAGRLSSSAWRRSSILSGVKRGAERGRRRLSRSTWAAVEVWSLTAVAHTIAGGALPSLPWLAGVAVLVVAASALVLRASLSTWVVLPALGASQVGLHLALTWMPPATTPPASMSHVHEMGAHTSTIGLASAGLTWQMLGATWRARCWTAAVWQMRSWLSRPSKCLALRVRWCPRPTLVLPAYPARLRVAERSGLSPALVGDHRAVSPRPEPVVRRVGSRAPTLP